MRIHFVGIGGIGVSALARYFLARGDKVSGSDAVESEITMDLEKLGVNISTPESSSITSPQPSPSKGEGEILHSPSFTKRGTD